MLPLYCLRIWACGTRERLLQGIDPAVGSRRLAHADLNKRLAVARQSPQTSRRGAGLTRLDDNETRLAWRELILLICVSELWRSFARPVVPGSSGAFRCQRRARTPLGWAMTQMNLGNALLGAQDRQCQIANAKKQDGGPRSMLGSRESGTKSGNALLEMPPPFLLANGSGAPRHHERGNSSAC
jgi:hypothetical protein